jgi:solute carrier family 25 iron transporter 28/37
MLLDQRADSLQTRMQVVNPSPTAVYSGISNAMVTISRVEGFRTLWRGLSSVIVGAGLSSPHGDAA